ncbi:hypothetical protein HVA01_25300 [Halovibrio variabilis]|uniref:RiboL-PSP-HEPN domain-containing protein n=1 Tax=Halovibrio variabilis TaxID=31910 RepID=A0A511UQL2_9GAMM|nr:MAE_28990/MAE_18760 family HEPN-like nuclease [Halovibrio variabilis]GEN28884.1 hypothetical protein HVA01_25300 [Halovibrio variabilis]
MAHKVVEEIVENNSWRDGEFAKFKKIAISTDESLWCRMCIPMIYAHWEGFVVSSLKALISHLNTLELHPENIPTKLVVVGLGESYKTLSGKQSFDQRIDFTEKFKLLYKNSIKFNSKINTRSNLKSDVLKELCEMFGFNHRAFSDKMSDIDRLVSIRNSIAHGENSIVPDMANVIKYIDSVNAAMDILVKEIDLFLVNEEFLLKEIA